MNKNHRDRIAFMRICSGQFTAGMEVYHCLLYTSHMSEGALVVDVKEDTDTKEIPPCIILKSDGASLYSTTDLRCV